MEKENWINKVEQSTVGMTKLEPSDKVWSRIQEAMSAGSVINFSRKQVLALAASFLILISLNFTLLFSSASNSKQSNDTETSVLEKQFNDGSINNLYK